MYKDAFVSGRPSSESLIRRQISLQSAVHSVSQETQHRPPEYVPITSNRVHSNPLMLVGAPKGDSKHNDASVILESTGTDMSQHATVLNSKDSHHVGVRVASTSRPNSSSNSNNDNHMDIASTSRPNSSSNNNSHQVSATVGSADCDFSLRGVEREMNRTHADEKSSLSIHERMHTPPSRRCNDTATNYAYPLSESEHNGRMLSESEIDREGTDARSNPGGGIAGDSATEEGAASRVAVVKLWGGDGQTDPQACIDIQQTDMHTEQTDMHAVAMSSAPTSRRDIDGAGGDETSRRAIDGAGKYSGGGTSRTSSESPHRTTQMKSGSESCGSAECLCMSSEDDDVHSAAYSSLLNLKSNYAISGDTRLQRHSAAESADSRQDKHIVRSDHHHHHDSSSAPHNDATHTNPNCNGQQDGVNTGFREVRSIGVREYGSRGTTAFVPLRAAFPVRQASNKTLSEDAGRRAAPDGAPRCVCVCVYVCVCVCVCKCVYLCMRISNKTLSEDAGRTAAPDGAPRCVLVCVCVCKCVYYYYVCKYRIRLGVEMEHQCLYVCVCVFMCVLCMRVSNKLLYRIRLQVEMEHQCVYVCVCGYVCIMYASIE
jgi:hypothetical protein